MPTMLSELPKEVMSDYECKLLHKKRPYLTGKSIRKKGLIIEEVIWVCNICDNQRDKI